jgi:hypothetical protein
MGYLLIFLILSLIYASLQPGRAGEGKHPLPHDVLLTVERQMTSLTKGHQIIRIVVKRVSINVMNRQRVAVLRVMRMSAWLMLTAPTGCILHPPGNFVPILWIAFRIKGHVHSLRFILLKEISPLFSSIK